ncbi:unnamed protein product [Brugia pahangi]|uniref:Secreted protein n=1 Tax=Brugia pahangi TaxID=6280 RepID=A0A0N4T3I2_BRUPA|nr:unnamed protein product [Brugia pahangi]
MAGVTVASLYSKSSTHTYTHTRTYIRTHARPHVLRNYLLGYYVIHAGIQLDLVRKPCRHCHLARTAPAFCLPDLIRKRAG